MTSSIPPYFVHDLPVNASIVRRLSLVEMLQGVPPEAPPIVLFRALAHHLSLCSDTAALTGGILGLSAMHHRVLRHIIQHHLTANSAPQLDAILASHHFNRVGEEFCSLFPGRELLAGKTTPSAWFFNASHPDRPRSVVLPELLLLRLAAENPALDPCRELLDDRSLAQTSPYLELMAGVETALGSSGTVSGTSQSLLQFLRTPIHASPTSLEGQLIYMRDHWGALLPAELLAQLEISIDVARTESHRPMGGTGVTQMLRFDAKAGDAGGYPEYEGYSPDTEWMPNVVMVAKMTYVWLDQLAKSYGRQVERLDQIPDEELDRLAQWGFTALWLIGVWERSAASQRIKNISGNSEAIASAYSLYDYQIANDLGGEKSLENLHQRCRERGIRLASDMVPNHTGLYSRWIVEHPDWFIQMEYPPYPAYNFTGPDLSASPEVCLQIEDGYWDRRDAAVVFKHYDHRNGRTRFIYHGNDGTSTPWNDTAQLNYLLPEVRRAVMDTILHVARQFPIIRFDAAMTLAKKHYQRLWYPQPGHGGIPSRAEHGMSREEFDAVFPKEFWREVVDRVAAEAPGTLLLAEAFWLMEGYFVRTLGMHRVYNSAFMNMLKMEENAKYRQTIKNVLEFDPRILQRFVNFMNNPDERTAVEQFGKEDKYLGACVLLVTMPGLPMFGHGQVEGFHEKYGMEYRRACWDEPVDQHLVWLHESRIFPLMKKRWLFSGSERFRLFDFWHDGQVDENVFSYSNGQGDDHALVIFHNRYADTEGWLHISSAWTTPGEEGLKQTTLAAALGIEADHDRYCRYREQATGLHYLVPADELTQRGMHLRLGPYQHLVFWEFSMVRDSAETPWGELCRRLGGSPVADLDKELIQVRYAPLIAAWEELLHLCRELVGNHTSAKKRDAAPLVEQTKEVARLLCAESMIEGDEEQLQSQLAVILPPGEEHIRLNGDRQPMAEAELLLLLIWTVCRHLPGIGPEAITSLGLDRPMETAFDATKRPLDLYSGDMVLLLQALLDLDGHLPAEEDAVSLLTPPWCTSFVGLHESGGYAWFSKERFELLLQWLVLLSSREGRDVSSARGFASRAEKAGYRLDLFQKPPLPLSPVSITP